MKVGKTRLQETGNKDVRTDAPSFLPGWDQTSRTRPGRGETLTVTRRDKDTWTDNGTDRQRPTDPLARRGERRFPAARAPCRGRRPFFGGSETLVHSTLPAPEPGADLRVLFFFFFSVFLDVLPTLFSQSSGPGGSLCCLRLRLTGLGGQRNFRPRRPPGARPPAPARRPPRGSPSCWLAGGRAGRGGRGGVGIAHWPWWAGAGLGGAGAGAAHWPNSACCWSLRLRGLCSQLTAAAALDLLLFCIRLPRGVPAPQLSTLTTDPSWEPYLLNLSLPPFLFFNSFFLSFSYFLPSLSPLLLTSFTFSAPSPHSNPQTLQKD